jgi:hypothetical protein
VTKYAKVGLLDQRDLARIQLVGILVNVARIDDVQRLVRFVFEERRVGAAQI